MKRDHQSYKNSSWGGQEGISLKTKQVNLLMLLREKSKVPMEKVQGYEEATVWQKTQEKWNMLQHGFGTFLRMFWIYSLRLSQSWFIFLTFKASIEIFKWSFDVYWHILLHHHPKKLKILKQNPHLNLNLNKVIHWIKWELTAGKVKGVSLEVRASLCVWW